MAGSCCSEDDVHVRRLQQRQARTLWVVLAINAFMFVTEFVAGWLAGSTALLGDSLDMLGDALVYGLSLFVVAKSLRWKAVSAGVKGVIMLGFGLLVLADAAYKIVAGSAPEATPMMAIGAVALAANIVCLLLLTRHRTDDVNMRSSWICSRNDLFANTGVIGAGVLVMMTGSIWPDIAVGVAIALLFLRSSVGVLRDARNRYAQGAADAGSVTPGVRS